MLLASLMQFGCVCVCVCMHAMRPMSWLCLNAFLWLFIKLQTIGTLLSLFTITITMQAGKVRSPYM